MSAILQSAPSVNYWRTTLADSISASADIIGLISTASMNPSQLKAPSVLVLDRIGASLQDTPEKREFISFASINGATLYSVTRGIDGTAQTHGAGARIEATPSIKHWNDLSDYLLTDHLSDGTHKVFSHVQSLTVTGISGLSNLRGDVILVPGANTSIYAVSGVSGYSSIVISTPSLQGAGGIPPFVYQGILSAASYITPATIIEDPITITSLSMVVASALSGASLIIDVNKNMTSIFTNQGTRLAIPGGGTYASTASIGTKTFVPGDILTLDVDNGGPGWKLSVLWES